MIFGILGIMAISEKLGPSTLGHSLGNTRNNSKSSAPYFTSNKIILKYQNYLRVTLYLFQRLLGPLGAAWRNWVKNRNS